MAMTEIEWKLYKENDTERIVGVTITTPENSAELVEGFRHMRSLSPGRVVFRDLFGGDGYYTWAAPEYLAQEFTPLGEPNFAIGPKPVEVAVVDDPSPEPEPLTRMSALRRAGELADDGDVGAAQVWLAISQEL